MASETNQGERCQARYVTADGRRHACVFQQARHVGHTVHAFPYVHAEYGHSFHDWRTRRRDNELRPLIIHNPIPGATGWLLITPDLAAPYAFTRTWPSAVECLHRWYSEQRKDNGR
ncbi:hypothetical protein [Rhodococcus zopfii]|uniref:hypothetical protein n=1 Tax=Rhodococcus zopfii TaxID=43772 RepID=UPI000932D492|nr:hypothetical protein [Rhodococcus zopfii]